MGPGSAQDERYETEQGAWGLPGPPGPPAPAASEPAGLLRVMVARPGLIALVAALLELVLIAAAANEWVSDRLVHAVSADGLGLRLLAGSWLTYTWRVQPQHGLTDTWGSELALIVTTLVVSGLLILAVVHGPVTFVRAFFGSWMAVIVATLAGAFVRGLIDPNSTFQLAGAGRATRAAFSAFGPSNEAVVGGAGLGFVVALFTAAAAVTTRRPTYPALDAGPAAPARPQDTPYAQPEQPPPYYGPPHPMPQPRPPSPWYAPLPTGAVGAEATTQLPRSHDPVEQATAHFPRPPDDDDLGQLDDPDVPARG